VDVGGCQTAGRRRFGWLKKIDQKYAKSNADCIIVAQNYKINDMTLKLYGHHAAPAFYEQISLAFHILQVQRPHMISRGFEAHSSVTPYYRTRLKLEADNHIQHFTLVSSLISTP
jgi:hypothetical protein